MRHFFPRDLVGRARCISGTIGCANGPSKTFVCPVCKDTVCWCEGCGSARFDELCDVCWCAVTKRQHINPVKGWARHAHMLRHKKGSDMAEWPVELRVREFPKSAE